MQDPVEEYTFKKERKDFAALWTVEATKALVEYYEELEQDVLGEVKALDIAIHADWVYDTLIGVVNDYDIYEVGNIETREQQLDWLRKQTQVLELKNDIILYVQF